MSRSWIYRPLKPRPILITELDWVRFFASVGTMSDFLQSFVVYLWESARKTPPPTARRSRRWVSGSVGALFVLGSYYNTLQKTQPLARFIRIIAPFVQFIEKVGFRLKLRISRIKWQCVPTALASPFSFLDNWTIKYHGYPIGGGNHPQTALDLIYFDWVGNSPKTSKSKT